MLGSGDNAFLRGNHGDREAMARMLLRNEDLIRRRIAGKLNANMRSVFDSQEIMSTLLRRMDKYVHDGGYNVETEAQFWCLVQRLISNAVIDKARVVRRLHSVEAEDEVIAAALLRQVDESTEDSQDIRDLAGRIVRAVDDQVNQEIVWMWLKGYAHSAIADALALTPEAVRKRWQRIREDVQEEFGADGLGASDT